jgi:hypothetical protein
MKSLIVLVIIGLFVPVVCFGQSQTGNASYNPAKSGYHIAHASLSFGTRVRVTNLKNSREVIAIVDGRIPVSDPRIADVYKDAGDAIGMAASGYTEVRLEQLLPEHPATVAQVPAQTPPVPVQPQAAAQASVPVQPRDPAQASIPVQPQAAAQVPVQTPTPARVTDPPPAENSQMTSPPPPYVVTEIPVPTVVQSCAASPICLAILVLAIAAVLLQVLILVLMLWGPLLPRWMWWRYPLWIRRHIRYAKKQRR